ncbi:MAG: hypothetical protein ACLUEQ_00350 [Cloacibacillus evryensis]
MGEGVGLQPRHRQRHLGAGISNGLQRVNEIKIPYRITPRRAGDIAVCYAETKKAERELGWKTRRTVEEMCRDAWRFEKDSSAEQF